MKPLDCPFVFVLWVDAVTRHGWVDEDESNKDGVEQVWSSGHMLARTAAEVKLASDVGYDSTRNRRIAIPMGMILRIHQGSMDGPILYEKKGKTRARKTQAPPQS